MEETLRFQSLAIDQFTHHFPQATCLPSNSVARLAILELDCRMLRRCNGLSIGVINIFANTSHETDTRVYSGC